MTPAVSSEHVCGHGDPKSSQSSCNWSIYTRIKHTTNLGTHLWADAVARVMWKSVTSSPQPASMAWRQQTDTQLADRQHHFHLTSDLYLGSLREIVSNLSTSCHSRKFEYFEVVNMSIAAPSHCTSKGAFQKLVNTVISRLFFLLFLPCTAW